MKSRKYKGQRARLLLGPRLPGAGNKQHHAAQLPAQILLLDVMGIFDLAPPARLPVDLETGGFGGLLDAEPRLSPSFFRGTAHVLLLSAGHRRVESGAPAGGPRAPRRRQPSGAHHALGRETDA